MSRPQSTCNRRPLQLRRQDPRETSTRTKHSRTRDTPTTSTTVLIGISADTQLPAPFDGILKKPFELTPGTAYFHQSFKLGMVPGEITSTSADMWDEEVVIGCMRVGGVHFIERPGTGDEIIGAIL